MRNFPKMVSNNVVVWTLGMKTLFFSDIFCTLWPYSTLTAPLY